LHARAESGLWALEQHHGLGWGLQPQLWLEITSTTRSYFGLPNMGTTVLI